MQKVPYRVQYVMQLHFPYCKIEHSSERESERDGDWMGLDQPIYRTILHGCHPVTRSFPNVLDPRISSSFKSTYMLSFRLADIDMCMCMCAHALAFGIIHTHV